jgi:protein-tyrosine phosphatase
MTDYHCHILPGLDDGPSTIDESIQMARLLSKAGFAAVYCTPHLIKNEYEASHTTVLQSIDELQAAINRHGISLRLLSGREYCIDNHFSEYLNELTPLEGTRYLLIEISSSANQGMIIDAINAVIRKGFTPMIAHPERCRILTQGQNPVTSKSQGIFKRNTIPGRIALERSYRHIELLDWLTGIECAFQCNVTSLAGAYGRSIQAAANQLLNQGIYTHFGTDAHSPEGLENLFNYIHTLKSRLYPHK